MAAAKPPTDPLKGHARYKKIKDLNQGKEVILPIEGVDGDECS